MVERRLAPAAPVAERRRWRLAGIGPVLAGLLLLTALVLAAPLVRLALGVDPAAVDLLGRLAPPSLAHPLGTDELGRDLLLRLLEGGRISLVVGFGGALLAALIGAVVGLLAGYAGGRVDALLMRLTDGVIALPVLPILIIASAIDATKLGLPGATAGSATATVAKLILLLALFGWTTVARLVRAEVLALKSREFVLAARALGAGPGRIMLRHLLPGCTTPLIVATTLAIGNIILAESILSFLGLGIQPPAASWGSMLTSAQDVIFEAPALAIWPGAMIFATVLLFNLLGDELRLRLDPLRPRRDRPASSESRPSEVQPA